MQLSEEIISVIVTVVSMATILGIARGCKIRWLWIAGRHPAQ